MYTTHQPTSPPRRGRGAHSHSRSRGRGEPLGSPSQTVQHQGSLLDRLSDRGTPWKLAQPPSQEQSSTTLFSRLGMETPPSPTPTSPSKSLLERIADSSEEREANAEGIDEMRGGFVPRRPPPSTSAVAHITRLKPPAELAGPSTGIDENRRTVGNGEDEDARSRESTSEAAVHDMLVADASQSTDATRARSMDDESNDEVHAAPVPGPSTDVGRSPAAGGVDQQPHIGGPNTPVHITVVPPPASTAVDVGASNTSAAHPEPSTSTPVQSEPKSTPKLGRTGSEAFAESRELLDTEPSVKVNGGGPGGVVDAEKATMPLNNEVNETAEGDTILNANASQTLVMSRTVTPTPAPGQRDTPKPDRLAHSASSVPAEDDEYWRTKLAQYSQETIDETLNSMTGLLIRNASLRKAEAGKAPVELDPARLRASLAAQPKRILEIIEFARSINKQKQQLQKNAMAQASSSSSSVDAGAKRRREDGQAHTSAMDERPCKVPRPSLPPIDTGSTLSPIATTNGDPQPAPLLLSARADEKTADNATIDSPREPLPTPENAPARDFSVATPHVAQEQMPLEPPLGPTHTQTVPRAGLQDAPMEVDGPSILLSVSPQSHKMIVDSSESRIRGSEDSLYPPVVQTKRSQTHSVEPRANSDATRQARDTDPVKHPAALQASLAQPETVMSPRSVTAVSDTVMAPGDSVTVSSTAPLPPMPQTPVPGLCLVAVGRSLPEVYELWFDVHEVQALAAQRWANREKKFDPQLEHLCFNLLCISRPVLEKANVEMDPAATPGVVANMVRRLPNKWPPKGRLIVQVNTDEENPESSPALLPWQLTGAVDVSSFIRPGTNSIRIIQLCDQSDYVFVLYVGYPPVDEVQKCVARTAKWDSFARGALWSGPQPD